MGSADFSLWGHGSPQASDSTLSLVSHYGATHSGAPKEEDDDVICTISRKAELDTP
jgi:hypothetical protein